MQTKRQKVRENGRQGGIWKEKLEIERKKVIKVGGAGLQEKEG